MELCPLSPPLFYTLPSASVLLFLFLHLKKSCLVSILHFPGFLTTFFWCLYHPTTTKTSRYLRNFENCKSERLQCREKRLYNNQCSLFTIRAKRIVFIYQTTRFANRVGSTLRHSMVTIFKRQYLRNYWSEFGHNQTIHISSIKSGVIEVWKQLAGAFVQ